MTHKHTKAMSRDAWTRIGRPAACIKFGSWDLKQEALEAAEPQTREIDVSPPTDRVWRAFGGYGAQANQMRSSPFHIEDLNDEI